MPLGGGSLSVLGTDALFLGIPTMGSHRRIVTQTRLPPASLFPLTSDEWHHAMRSLTLTPQQAKIVELILHGRQDKQIASALHLSQATVRTHLARLFARLEINDRVELVLRVLASCRQDTAGESSLKSM